jgi:hypothetical protein
MKLFLWTYKILHKIPPFQRDEQLKPLFLSLSQMIYVIEFIIIRSKVVIKSQKDVDASLLKVVDQTIWRILMTKVFLSILFLTNLIQIQIMLFQYLLFCIYPQIKSIIFSIYHQTLEKNHQICPHPLIQSLIGSYEHSSNILILIYEINSKFINSMDFQHNAFHLFPSNFMMSLIQ